MDNQMTRQETAVSLYLDLMKRCLLDSIFIDDPLANFILYQKNPQTKFWKRWAILFLERFLLRYRLKLVQPYSTPWVTDFTALSELELRNYREYGKEWPARAHTMIGQKRLDNLQFCVETVLRDGIPGDLIETGVWRGGACIFMRAILAAYGDQGRSVWVADSFRGLPPPSPDKYAADLNDNWYTFDALAVSLEEVQANFRRYDLLDDRVRFLKGWFKDTLPTAPIERLAVLRLDGDMYESTIQALNALYDKLSPGGFVIIDDYFLRPCAQAVHDFRNSRGITDPIIDIDEMGSYWQRSA